MAIKEYSPRTPAIRFVRIVDRSGLSRVKPLKRLLRPTKKTGGRNFQGFITTRHIGGGHKQRFRLIDFRRDKLDVPGTVSSVEYDPNRSCRIALVKYRDGEKRYILAPKDLKVGDEVVSAEVAEPKVGNAMPLKNIPLGLQVHNIELVPGSGGKMVRSAGASAVLAAREGDYAHITLPSGEVRKVHVNCRATIGMVGNVEHMAISLGKAGRSRWLGIRPSVRGTAMNPVSHPLGGGEGRTKGGRHPCSPTGVLAKGGKTRKRRQPSDRFIIRRRRKGPH